MLATNNATQVHRNWNFAVLKYVQCVVADAIDEPHDVGPLVRADDEALG